MKSVLRGTVKVSGGGRWDCGWLSSARASGDTVLLFRPPQSDVTPLGRRLAHLWPRPPTLARLPRPPLGCDSRGDSLLAAHALQLARCGPVPAPRFRPAAAGRAPGTAKGEGGAGGQARLGAWEAGGVAASVWLTPPSHPTPCPSSSWFHALQT